MYALATPLAIKDVTALVKFDLSPHVSTTVYVYGSFDGNAWSGQLGTPDRFIYGLENISGSLHEISLIGNPIDIGPAPHSSNTDAARCNAAPVSPIVV